MPPRANGKVRCRRRRRHHQGEGTRRGVRRGPTTELLIVYRSRYSWSDEDWLARRHATDPLTQPFSVYEVHAGSWHRALVAGARGQLVPYVAGLGFTHVELMPVMQHPYAPSWGYQVSGYFAPQSTFGPPDDFRALVDAFHPAGIGVLLDWVPAHFPETSGHLPGSTGRAVRARGSTPRLPIPTGAR